MGELVAAARSGDSEQRGNIRTKPQAQVSPTKEGFLEIYGTIERNGTIKTLCYEIDPKCLKDFVKESNYKLTESNDNSGEEKMIKQIEDYKKITNEVREKLTDQDAGRLSLELEGFQADMDHYKPLLLSSSNNARSLNSKFSQVMEAVRNRIESLKPVWAKYGRVAVDSVDKMLLLFGCLLFFQDRYY